MTRSLFCLTGLLIFACSGTFRRAPTPDLPPCPPPALSLRGVVDIYSRTERIRGVLAIESREDTTSLLIADELGIPLAAGTATRNGHELTRYFPPLSRKAAVTVIDLLSYLPLFYDTILHPCSVRGSTVEHETDSAEKKYLSITRKNRRWCFIESNNQVTVVEKTGDTLLQVLPAVSD